MSKEERDYIAEAKSNAQSTATLYFDNIMEQLLDNEELSDDLFNDYPRGDEHHNCYHVDSSGYSLKEATNLIYQLDEYEETDSGLWEGLECKEAVIAIAAYTYGNAIMSFWREIIKEIKEDPDVQDMVEILSEFKSRMEDEENPIPTYEEEGYEEWRATLHDYDYGETKTEIEQSLKERVKELIKNSN